MRSQDRRKLKVGPVLWSLALYMAVVYAALRWGHHFHRAPSTPGGG